MRGRRGGFTLIELLVVIAIILLIAALSLPSVSTFLRGKVFNQAAQTVKEAFLRARSKAITEREIHYVLIFVRDGSFTLPRPSGGTLTISGKRGQLKVIDSNEKQKDVRKELQEVGDTLNLPDGARFDVAFALSGTGPAGFYVEFRYDGSCIMSGKADSSSSNLSAPDPYKKAPYVSSFDLVIRGPEDKDGDTTERRRCYIDIVQGTGQLRFRLAPL